MNFRRISLEKLTFVVYESFHHSKSDNFDSLHCHLEKIYIYCSNRHLAEKRGFTKIYYSEYLNN